MKLAGTSKRRTPRPITRLRCIATRKVNQDDAVTAACTSRYGRSVGVQRRSACPISFLFFRACSYPGPRRETCPRGKQVCSTAKLDNLFRCRPAVCAKTGLQICQRHRALAAIWATTCARQTQFRLTTPGLSRKIISAVRMIAVRITTARLTASYFDLDSRL
jgi:hypothetical protein